MLYWIFAVVLGCVSRSFIWNLEDFNRRCEELAVACILRGFFGGRWDGMNMFESELAGASEVVYKMGCFGGGNLGWCDCSFYNIGSEWAD